MYETPLNRIDKSVSVGSSSTSVLTHNSTRVSSTFTNDSDETIYLQLGSAAAANTGIRLNANGGSYEINTSNPWYGDVNAICASGSKTLCAIEVSRVPSE
jgi:hypothetical protein